jgi:hypothetical protein
MSRSVGLWVDHRKAIVVSLTRQGEEHSLVISKAQRQLRRTGDAPLQGRSDPQKNPMSDAQQRKYTAALNHFYDAVVAAVRDADGILIFGPGEAKGELKKRFTRHGLAGRVIRVETLDKVTDRQLAAKVRDYFARQA